MRTLSVDFHYLTDQVLSPLTLRLGQGSTPQYAGLPG
ncbi:hypothetical protein Adeg_0852 [Ammonifex degensii KC4]|uniref:Uncharacterized protein n=1 Tax=Ammonifex degensii (strain DSM 10501 / KC4) TaxID=429009 RepID=C9RCL5_AMMDK|nr:hypothetical protein Adeg_0852 [Ammonifex degensii KC4]